MRLTEDEKLKPCPFCGGKAHLLKMGYPYFVYCLNCDAKVKGVGYGDDGYMDAIERWNSRVEPTGMLEWISVKDRLPPANTDVLIWFKRNAAVGVIINGEWNVNSGDGWVTEVFEDDWQPTHWMPLPEPPKMEGVEE